MLLVFIDISCSQKILRTEGFVQLRVRDYDSVTGEFINEAIVPDINIWFMGNLVIQEIKTINVRDSFGVRTKRTPVAYYLFIDRSSRSFYHYASFIDSATILDKYTQADTASLRGSGGWAFYRRHSLGITGTPHELGDTLINKIVYKRVKVVVERAHRPLTIICYFRCDKRGTMFLFDKEFSEKMGCPLTRLESFPSSPHSIASLDEIAFIRDGLTKEERKVFEAWKQNLKKYPIRK